MAENRATGLKKTIHNIRSYKLQVITCYISIYTGLFGPTLCREIYNRPMEKLTLLYRKDLCQGSLYVS